MHRTVLCRYQTARWQVSGRRLFNLTTIMTVMGEELNGGKERID